MASTWSARRPRGGHRLGRRRRLARPGRRATARPRRSATWPRSSCCVRSSRPRRPRRFEALARDSDSGYAVLARLQAAQALGEAGDSAGKLEMLAPACRGRGGGEPVPRPRRAARSAGDVRRGRARRSGQPACEADRRRQSLALQRARAARPGTAARRRDRGGARDPGAAGRRPAHARQSRPPRGGAAEHARRTGGSGRRRRRGRARNRAGRRGGPGRPRAGSVPVNLRIAASRPGRAPAGLLGVVRRR